MAKQRIMSIRKLPDQTGLCLFKDANFGGEMTFITVSGNIRPGQFSSSLATGGGYSMWEQKDCKGATM
ncbi:MAG: hypothetical protein CMJ78_02200 [Planctomycetaceae bacterium]|nr:hypothetical protein [Planctomycetaceae bacterium]